MRVIAVPHIAFLLLFAGCTTDPIGFRLEASGPASANVRVRSISAETDPTPHTCTTPCTLELAPDTAYEIELEADGYHRARLPLEFQTIQIYRLRSDDEELRLVVPLIPRVRPGGATPRPH